MLRSCYSIVHIYDAEKIIKSIKCPEKKEHPSENVVIDTLMSHQKNKNKKNKNKKSQAVKT